MEKLPNSNLQFVVISFGVAVRLLQRKKLRGGACFQGSPLKFYRGHCNFGPCARLDCGRKKSMKTEKTPLTMHLSRLSIALKKAVLRDLGITHRYIFLGSAITETVS